MRDSNNSPKEYNTFSAAVRAPNTHKDDKSAQGRLTEQPFVLRFDHVITFAHMGQQLLSIGMVKPHEPGPHKTLREGNYTPTMYVFSDRRIFRPSLTRRGQIL